MGRGGIPCDAAHLVRGGAVVLATTLRDWIAVGGDLLVNS
jgi:hypothetical protein